MATITEDYVSYETAKLLKENGFIVPYDSIIGAYINGDFLRGIPEYPYPYNEVIDVCSIQMAMKWLREVHNTNIDIVSVWNQKRFEYQVFVVTPENAKHCYIDDKLYPGYEEACEAGIKYCLENLIK